MMKPLHKIGAVVGTTALSVFAAARAWAATAAPAAEVVEEAVTAVAEGPIKAPTAEQMAGMVDKGDTTWMLVSAVLVLMMSIPGLALFYGGLVRTKNMLSVLMQVLTIVSVAALVWVSWGYSLAFTSGSPYIGGLSKAFLAGGDRPHLARSLSHKNKISERGFLVFH